MEEYITLDELSEIVLARQVYSACAYGTKQRTAGRLRSFFSELSKKAMFITSVPFYWFIIFKYMIGWFDMGFFVFVIGCSMILSMTGGNWGMLNGLMK